MTEEEHDDTEAAEATTGEATWTQDIWYGNSSWEQWEDQESHQEWAPDWEAHTAKAWATEGANPRGALGWHRAGGRGSRPA